MEKSKYIDTDKINNIKSDMSDLLNKLDHKTTVIFAIDCAKHVLKYFEVECPNDERPREAITATTKWVVGDIKTGEVRKAASASHAAAREAHKDSAISAARSAGHAAATTHVARHAIHAAAYAVKAFAYTVEPLERNKATMQESEWQYNYLLKLKK